MQTPYSSCTYRTLTMVKVDLYLRDPKAFRDIIVSNVTNIGCITITFPCGFIHSVLIKSSDLIYLKIQSLSISGVSSVVHSIHSVPISQLRSENMGKGQGNAELCLPVTMGCVCVCQNCREKEYFHINGGF